jgi:hypothetical protein
MREKIIEQQLVKAVKHTGGMCPKFVSPGLNGMPDRLVLLNEGHMRNNPGSEAERQSAKTPAEEETQTITGTWIPGICSG